MLVLAIDERLTAQEVALHIEGPHGEVDLAGRLHRLRPGTPDLAGRLHEHARCLTEMVTPGPVSLWRLDVERVMLTRCKSDQRSVVPIADYAITEPDRFGAFAGQVAVHLTEEHPEVVRSVAERRLADRDAGPVIGAQVVAVTPDELLLEVVTAEGGWTVSLGMVPRLEHPHEACGRLWSQACGS